MLISGEGKLVREQIGFGWQLHLSPAAMNTDACGGDSMGNNALYNNSVGVPCIFQRAVAGTMVGLRLQELESTGILGLLNSGRLNSGRFSGCVGARFALG